MLFCSGNELNVQTSQKLHCYIYLARAGILMME